MLNIDVAKVPYIRTAVPGPKSIELLTEQGKYETASVTYPKSFPIGIKSMKDSVIEDVDGNLFIDWLTGISVLNLGYSEFIRDAVRAEMESTWHALEIPTEARIEFLKALRSSFPSNMQDYKTIFGISGADACETAVNLAHAVSGRDSYTIVFEGAYHGVSGGIIAATYESKYKAGNNSPGFKVIRSPYPGILWENYSVGDVIDYIQTAIRENSADSLLVEPVLGEGGYVVPPEGFLKALRKLCDENNIIMIVDEVQAGMGRTGKMWAFEYDGIKPDIVCAGKSVGGGIPMSLVYYRGDFDEKLPTPFHLGTYRANPLALAAGREVLKRTPAVLDSVKERGKYLLKAFSEIDSDVIAQVRGKGFMIGIELGKNGGPVDSNTMARYKKLLIENGIVMHTCGHYGNTFRFMGALNIDQKLLDTGVEIFEKVVRTKW
ncbi:MAG: aminotransferase class III-fold pyridoxal phosphate-dependent enzyme [Ferroplasma sp.]|uniref:aspartate aminotransferase family protein n=1 Tax=Ferroplasma sp. TaxID=2591003 RepID=UPI00281610FC|nr:aminotransferase class III-fold pyridoxal phosphate-dependent enzyme [Ferroplasma sp.]WMT50717.1 MAG: aminotransferase class III-fold pyridoxal phosphate-dependent enzyme [Ferroplasma sp.]